MINKKVLNLAYKLKQNAVKNNNRYFMKRELDDFIFDYKINDGYSDMEEMLTVLERIVEDGFEIGDFELCEIPIETVFCFCNKDETKFFDIDVRTIKDPDLEDVWYWEAYPSYMDDNHQTYEAKTIQEAIDKFTNDV